MEQRGHRAPSERGFECEIQPFGNRAFEQPLPLLPGRTVRFLLGHARMNGKEPLSRLVWVEVFGAAFEQHRAAYAAFSRAVGPCQNVDAGKMSPVSHAGARPLPQPFRGALV